MWYSDPTIQTALKQYKCDWCWQHVVPGQTYKRYRFADGQEAGTVRLHHECFDAMQELAKEEGGHCEWTPGMERPKVNHEAQTA